MLAGRNPHVASSPNQARAAPPALTFQPPEVATMFSPHRPAGRGALFQTVHLLHFPRLCGRVPRRVAGRPRRGGFKSSIPQANCRFSRASRGCAGNRSDPASTRLKGLKGVRAGRGPGAAGRAGAMARAAMPGRPVRNRPASALWAPPGVRRGGRAALSPPPRRMPGICPKMCCPWIQAGFPTGAPPPPGPKKARRCRRGPQNYMPGGASQAAVVIGPGTDSSRISTSSDVPNSL